MYRIASASLTDTGRVREINEDSIVESGNLFAVADGMGGHLAGEVASALALSVIQQYVEDNLGLISGEKLVEKAVGAANAAIYAKAHSSAKFKDMGTTVTLLYREGDTAIVGHVGDSRAYLYRVGVLRQLTRDHSLVAQLVEEGEITEAQAWVHPQRSIITRALGLDQQVEVDIVSVQIVAGDLFLLATDGLTGLVLDADIATVVGEEIDPVSAAQRLVGMALAAGGTDNVSVVMARFDESDTVIPARNGRARRAEPAAGEGEVPVPPGGQAPASEKHRSRIRWVIAGIVLLLLVGGCLVTMLYFYNTTYFVGVKDNKVVLYKGFPFWELSSVAKNSGVDVALLSEASRRKVLSNTEVESHAGALKTLAALEREARDYRLVPYVIGQPYARAKKLIEDRGLMVEEPPEIVGGPTGNVKAETVIGQQPEANVRVGKGTAVKLKVVGSGPVEGV